METTTHAPAAGDFLQVAIKTFQDGGMMMYPIALMSILAIAIIVERIYTIMFVYESNGAALMQKVQRLIVENNIDEAVKIVNSKKDAAIYKVFKAALVNADRPFDEVQDHVHVAILSIVPKLQRRLPYLFTIANSSTLMGLLGTIFGLVETFSAIGAVEGSQKQLMLSSGIATALNATAFGLFVAIPCMLTYGYLFDRINNMVDEMEHYSSRLLVLMRTGSQYFDRFSSEAMFTTEQTPQKYTGEDKTGETPIIDTGKKRKKDAA